MFDRCEPVCTSPTDAAAYAMLRQAEETSESDVQAAQILFRRAFKMSPALAELYQM